MAGLAAAGAAAGTAIMPGIGTAIGGIAGALLDSSMTGSSGTGPAGTSSAAVAVYGSGINADNWSINFGGRQDVRAEAAKTMNATGPTATTAAQGGTVMPAQLSGMGSDIAASMASLGVPSWAWFAVGGLVLWKLSKSRK
jgi:hypothetical protein